MYRSGGLSSLAVQRCVHDRFFHRRNARCSRSLFRPPPELASTLPARELGQKRWVNVDEAAGNALEHRFVQDTHESGKDDKFDACITQHFDELVFCFGFETRAKSPWRQKAFGTPNSRAISRIGASSTSDTTRRASAASSPDRMRSRIARAVASFAGSENADWQPFHLILSSLRTPALADFFDQSRSRITCLKRNRRISAPDLFKIERSSSFSVSGV